MLKKGVRLISMLHSVNTANCCAATILLNTLGHPPHQEYEKRVSNSQYRMYNMCVENQALGMQLIVRSFCILHHVGCMYMTVYGDNGHEIAFQACDFSHTFYMRYWA